MPHTQLPDHGAVLAEVREVRRAGVVRLRELRVPGLAAVADGLEAGAPGAPHFPAVERLLRLAVSRIGGGTLQEAAEYSLGLAQGTRDWPAADRRKRAAQVYGISVERFRKHHELMVLGEVAEQIIRMAPVGRTVVRDAPVVLFPGTRRAAPRLAPAHRRLRVRAARITVHVHPADLLRDVDVVVSPANTYFALPEAYKSSVAASLRRAGALRDPAGGLVEDRIHDELRAWVARHGRPGGAVAPGTVAVTGAGALERQGVRRLYHAAVAVPRAGTNDYDVLPADVTRAVARAFALLGEEAGRHRPPLTSLCLPLLGAGRGGLAPADSLAAMWAAVEAELARGARWDLHFVVRRAERADLIEQLLGAEIA
ncbi:hypothetical protein [Streptomyces sp. TLI_146]|uniref:hypothetical protein n=1 Tax=Streptomyces sp. TLI_146 TaxID=1938858 RepID=UPI000C6FDC93|nr:hypothetical protein [Streptomyces sp. TLI_146]PKV87549.1 O-acetyl-ADP-ribose deacetylase (regulator of RNase III) [Streptomyces sp. TLI_146]